ncbi:MAG: serine hydrolase [Cyanobacteria bacterium P01_H01_bin.121]
MYQQAATLQPASRRWRLLRTLVLALGLGSLVGTAIAVLETKPAPPAIVKPELGSTSNADFTAERQIVVRRLQQDLVTFFDHHGLSRASVYWLDLDTGLPVAVRADATFQQPELLTLPILLVSLRAIDQGTIHLTDQVLTTQPLATATLEAFTNSTLTEPRSSENSVDLDTRYPSAPATLPIAAPTATVAQLLEELMLGSGGQPLQAAIALVNHLGGAADVNQHLQALGLQQTVLEPLTVEQQLRGATSATDLAQLFHNLSERPVLSLRSRDRAFQLLLAAQSPASPLVSSHDLSLETYYQFSTTTLEGGVGRIDLPTGQRYILALIFESELEHQAQHDNALQADELQRDQLDLQTLIRQVTERIDHALAL